MNPHDYEYKVIHVGTIGTFHKPTSGFNVTRCGIDMTDARLTSHRLSDYEPCGVCFVVRDCAHAIVANVDAALDTGAEGPLALEETE